MSCQEMTLSLGVYVLGSLDPQERAVVDEHLASCPLCRAELSELQGLPALLDRLTLEDLSPEPIPVSDDLFERVAAKARAEDAEASRFGHRQYRRLVAIAAAFVFVVGGGFGAWALGHGDSKPKPGSHGVQMAVSLTAQKTGTSYTVNVSGLPIDEHCKLIAVAKDGTRDVAGEWDATYEGQAKETGSISIPRSQLSRLVLLGTDGQQLAVVSA